MNNERSTENWIRYSEENSEKALEYRFVKELTAKKNRKQ